MIPGCEVRSTSGRIKRLNVANDGFVHDVVLSAFTGFVCQNLRKQQETNKQAQFCGGSTAVQSRQLRLKYLQPRELKIPQTHLFISTHTTSVVGGAEEQK